MHRIFHAAPPKLQWCEGYAEPGWPAPFVTYRCIAGEISSARVPPSVPGPGS
jgi:hypothetical protein